MKYWRVAISGFLIAGGIAVAQRTNDFFISLVGSVVLAHVIVYALAIVLIFSAQMLFAFDLWRDWENEQLTKKETEESQFFKFMNDFQYGDCEIYDFHALRRDSLSKSKKSEGEDSE